LADEGVARNVATPVPRPLTPVEIGKPVAFVNVALAGVPRTGVTSVGLVANTRAPEPVSSVTAVARLADEGAARNEATPVPSPDTPVEIGSPVALVRVAAEGVPRLGVVSDGLVPNTKAPDPVSPVTRAARLADDGVATKVSKPAARVTPFQLFRLASTATIGLAGSVASTSMPFPATTVLT
jgi:hypothetical protein